MTPLLLTRFRFSKSRLKAARVIGAWRLCVCSLFAAIFFLAILRSAFIWLNSTRRRNDSVDYYTPGASSESNRSDNIHCVEASSQPTYTREGSSTNTTSVTISGQKYTEAYCVAYDLWEVNDKYLQNSPQDTLITFAVHSSLDYLKYLEEQVATWDGLISLALVLDYSRLQLALQRLKRARRSGKYERVSVHLLWETHTGECPSFAYYHVEDTTLLDDERLTFDNLVGACADHSVYPINIARNVARNGVKTPLFVSGDIEQIFSKNYESRMRALAAELLLNQHLRTVLVHRRFEVEDGEVVPRTLANLRDAINRSVAVEFHHYVYAVGHHIPFLDHWLMHNDTGVEATIFKELPYFNSEWEPQFVADQSAPRHDESFPFRVRSNTHLGTELCRAGYTFTVVNDLFTVHRGVKRAERNEFRQIVQTTSNTGALKTIVREFRQRLNKMYPTTKKICPTFANGIPDLSFMGM